MLHRLRRATFTAALPLAFGVLLDANADEAKATKEMDQVMRQSMQEMQAMPMTGNVDHDFAMMMRNHHQSGATMAEVEMQHGKDPKMREMAKKIAASQKKEIKEFDQWLQAQGESAEAKAKPEARE